MLFWTAVLACITAIGFGLATVGGPGHARMEKNDGKRFQDLQELGDIILCDGDNLILPETLEGVSFCSRNASAQRDPTTDAPYDYRKLTKNMFEVCANFKILTEGDGGNFDRAVALHWNGGTGCLRFQRKGGDGKWLYVGPKAQ